MFEPQHRHANSANEPKQRVYQIHPDCVLHPLDAIVSLGILLDVHVAKEAEERDPEDEEYCVPNEEEGDARDEGDHVDQRRDG